MASAGSCAAADFCSEFAGDTDVSFFRVYQGEPASRLIVKKGDLLVVADMSPLVLGHVLLLPVEHHLSFAALIADGRADVRRLISWLKPIYRRTFGEFAVLEHGSSGDERTGACVTHAHWHIVPLSAERIRRSVVEDRLTPVMIPSLADLGKPPWSANPYFYVSDGVWHALFTPTGRQPKQYLRSVIGRLLSISDPEWDYAVVVRKHLLRQTLAMTEWWK
ncbi:HIT domain-containing protein [Kibdelosporangium philippinense]|uniref:HIT domain-containing protein n=1 Tax=Kibdelosporangium philippinense TaxID=211113 RepID=A0ABS8ZRZ2_9PSEU|nr:HIT domain-containing protein [Kibdelosporangium philippinense]MCE7008592.1 HIT domain-containing protein [Kibdelosporangium philippinense]